MVVGCVLILYACACLSWVGLLYWLLIVWFLALWFLLVTCLVGCWLPSFAGLGCGLVC